MSTATRIRHGDPVADAAFMRPGARTDQWHADSESIRGRVYTTAVSPELDAAVCNCQSRTGKCWHQGAALVVAKRARVAALSEERRSMTQEPTTAVAVRGSEQDDESTALVPVAVRPQQALLPARGEIETMKELALVMPKSAGVAIPKGIDTPAKAFVVMLAGWELGIRPMTAFRHIFVVNGRTEPDAQLMMGIVLAKDSTARFEFLERTHQRCRVQMTRAGRSPIVSEYTVEDAKKSGQMKTEREFYDKEKRQKVKVQITDSPWLLYTRDMLAWAAVKRAIRLGAPDCVNAIEAVGDSAGMAEGMFELAEVEATPLPPQFDTQHLPAPEPDEAEYVDAPAAAEPEMDPEFTAPAQPTMALDSDEPLFDQFITALNEFHLTPGSLSAAMKRDIGSGQWGPDNAIEWTRRTGKAPRELVREIAGARA